MDVQVPDGIELARLSTADVSELADVYASFSVTSEHQLAEVLGVDVDMERRAFLAAWSQPCFQGGFSYVARDRSGALAGFWLACDWAAYYHDLYRAFSTSTALADADPRMTTWYWLDDEVIRHFGEEAGGASMRRGECLFQYLVWVRPDQRARRLGHVMGDLCLREAVAAGYESTFIFYSNPQMFLSQVKDPGEIVGTFLQADHPDERVRGMVLPSPTMAISCLRRFRPGYYRPAAPASS